MAAANLPVSFAEIAIGAILLTKGSEAVKAGFSSSSTSTGGGAGTTGGTGALPKNASKFSSNQQTFLSRLQADTGLDPAVIAGWMAAEEPPGAASAPNGANNWLNIGAFDSGGWAGGGANVWADPTTAADATASFITGHTVNGVTSPLHAAASIHAIAAAAGQSISAQVLAIQNSHWATSGYPGLLGIVMGFA